MYRCQLCGVQVPAGTSCHRIVVETRPKFYRDRLKAFRFARLEDGKRKEQVRDDPGGRGSEIAREVNACPACASRAEANPIPARAAERQSAS